METIFVVGSTGLLGDAVVREALRRRWSVYALVRNAHGRRELSAKWPGAVLVNGDVAKPGLGIALEDARQLRDVTYVLDAFGRFAFGLTNEEARLNVDGAVESVRFASTLPKLRAYAHVGGYRVADGEKGEGAYEESKRVAVREVDRIAAELGVPLTQLHPASVLGDSQTGATSQRLGLGDMVRELYEKRLPAHVGPADTWVPVVFSDDFARLALAALEDRATKSASTAHWIFDEETPRLAELVDEVSAILGVDAPTRRVPVGVVRALPKALTKVEPETLSFLDARTYPTESLRELRTKFEIAPPPRHEGLRRWLAHLVATEFLEVEAEGRLVEGTFVGTLGTPHELVFLHGLPLAHRSWLPLVQALGQGGFAPDLPGLGRSGSGTPNGAWLERTIDALGLEETTLVAHSYGAVPALEFAAAHPDRVRAIVLVSPFFLQARAGALLRCSTTAAMLFRLASAEKLGNSLFRNAPEIARQTHRALQRRGVSRAAARLLAKASSLEERARLRTLLDEVRDRVPMQLVYGVNDPIEGAGHAIENAGHAPHVDEPEAVADAMLAFLNSQTPRSQARRRPARLG
ncbi:MAG: alpha/beta fold hydrolase [Myxococcota bacterium]